MHILYVSITLRHCIISKQREYHLSQVKLLHIYHSYVKVSLIASDIVSTILCVNIPQWDALTEIV